MWSEQYRKGFFSNKRKLRFNRHTRMGWKQSRDGAVMNICDIRNNMEHLDIKGKIIDYNRWMIVLDDKSGRTFIRYKRRGKTREEWQKMLEQIKIGNNVSIQDCYSVNYSGILQLKMSPKGRITML